MDGYHSLQTIVESVIDTVVPLDLERLIFVVFNPFNNHVQSLGSGKVSLTPRKYVFEIMVKHVAKQNALLSYETLRSEILCDSMLC